MKWSEGNWFVSYKYPISIYNKQISVAYIQNHHTFECDIWLLYLVSHIYVYERIRVSIIAIFSYKLRKAYMENVACHILNDI